MANRLTNFNNLRVGRRYHIELPGQNGWFMGTFVSHMTQGRFAGLAKFNEIITDRLGYDEHEEDPRLSIYFDRRHTFQDLFIPELEGITERKAKDQAVRDMYDKATRDPSHLDEYGKPMAQSAQPGHGPADDIRNALGIQPPKGSMGGRTRRRRARKTRRRHK